MHPLDTAWQSITREFDIAKTQAAEAARVHTTNELNQIARRLKQYENESCWADTVLDGAANFASSVALFGIENGLLRLRGSRNLTLPQESSFALENGAAFRNALETKDTVVALRTPNEVSELLMSTAPIQRAYIMPISNGQRIAAMLFASADEYLDVNALELIANMSSAVLERHSQSPVHVQISPVTSPASETRVASASSGMMDSGKTELKRPPLPAWSRLPANEKAVHIRAQRFARVKVAEMQLYQPEVCRAGRDQKNLYLFLKQEVDNAREQFRTQFMTTQNMVDYLHLELVRTLAANDEHSLGDDYPGQMV